LCARREKRIEKKKELGREWRGDDVGG